jgi:predicted TIM-barrel fold metal-dependent hydrolase
MWPLMIKMGIQCGGGRDKRRALMITRRRLLKASAAAAALSGMSSLGLAGTRPRALKNIVRSRTFDFEVHLNDRELYTGTEEPDIVPVPADRLDADMHRWGWQETEFGYLENRARLNRYRERMSIELRAEFLLGELDEAGIDTAVHQMVDHSAMPSTIGRYYVAGFDRMMEDAMRIREQNPNRIITMVGIDPRSGPADAVRRFEVALTDYGCKGLGEVVLQQFETYPHDKSMYPLYEKCVEYNVPFVGNCEGPSPYTMPLEFEQVAKDFPDLLICLAGSGRPRVVQSPQSRRPMADALRLANEYENIFLGIAASQRRDNEGIEQFLGFLRQCFDSDAKGKIMYGSDFPVAVAAYSAKDWIDVVINRAGDHGFEFSDAEISRFFSSNALDFLKEVL